jgi:hypothetical protein
MNPPTVTDPCALDDPHTTLGTTTSSGSVPAIVSAALNRWWCDYRLAAAMPARTDLDQAIRADRLAVLADRRARWWRVLANWTYSPAGTVPLVFGAAADMSADKDRDSARSWRETAADWRARADHEPTSDAAGALSNHHELGIAS